MHAEFPKHDVEGLFNSPDAIVNYRPVDLVMEVLHDGEVIYFGKFSTNETTIHLRKYQQEVTNASIKENR